MKEFINYLEVLISSDNTSEGSFSGNIDKFLLQLVKSQKCDLIWKSLVLKIKKIMLY